MLSSLEWSVDPVKLFLLVPTSNFQTLECINICFFQLNFLNKKESKLKVGGFVLFSFFQI